MMASIGSVVLDLQAQTASFSAGLAKAQKDMKSFADSATSVKRVVVGAFAAVGAAMGVDALKSFITGNVDAITATSRLADSLGLTYAQLKGIQQAAKNAGVDTEEMNGAFLKLTKTLGEAVTEGGSVADALKDLGLDANNLVNQDLDTTIKQIADGLSRIQNPIERNRYLITLFGRDGAKLAQVFAAGAKGIEDAEKNVLKTGQALSILDAAKVTLAWKAMDELGNRAEGVKNQLIVALAPAITGISDKIAEITPSAEKWRSIFESAVSKIGKAVGWLINLLQDLKIALLQTAADVTLLLAQTLEGFHKISTGGASDMLGKMMGLSHNDMVAFNRTLTDTIVKTAEASIKLQEMATNAAGAGKWSDVWASAFNKIAEAAKNMAAKPLTFKPFDEAQTDSAVKVGKMIEDLQKELASVGGDDTAKKMKELFDLRPHINFKDFDSAMHLIDEIEKRKEDGQRIGGANKITSENVSPYLKLERELKNLKALYDDSLISADTFALASKKAQDEALSASKVDMSRRAGAMERTFNFSLDTRDDAKSNDPLEQIKKTSENELKEAKQQTQYLRQIWQQTGIAGLLFPAPF